MAFWDVLTGGRVRGTEVTGGALARAAGPEPEPVFLPRRDGARGLPANTRATTVLGAQPHTFARGREVAALLLWTFAVFFALALASYAGDPEAAAQPDATPIIGENWVGPVGAVVARAAVTLVGL